MPEMSQKTWMLVVATLILVVGYLGFQLSDRNNTIGLLNDDNAGLALEKDQLILDLEKMRFSYDTLRLRTLCLPNSRPSRSALMGC